MDVPCDLCGGDRAEVLFAAGVAQASRIVRCRDCRLIFASPRGVADHEDYERSTAVGLLEGVADRPDHPYRWRYDKERLQVRDFRRTRALLDRMHPQRGRMVEVGSGFGFLLRSFKDTGWDVLGIDPWRELPPFTASVHGIATRPATLEQAALPAGSVDVLVMLHVIEHVPSPTAVLSEVFRVLRPGGHLVLETPRYDTLMFRLMGRRERSLRQDGHIYFFTDDTLRRAADKVGFRLTDLRHVGRSMTADRFMWNIGNIPKHDGFARAVNRLSGHLRTNRIRFTLNLADMVRVVLEKPAIPAGAGVAGAGVAGAGVAGAGVAGAGVAGAGRIAG